MLKEGPLKQKTERNQVFIHANVKPSRPGTPHAMAPYLISKKRNENKKRITKKDIMRGVQRKRNRRIPLEILVEGEGAAIFDLLLSVFGFLLGAGHNTGLLVVTNTLLKKVCLAREGDVVHEVEGVRGVVEFLVSESNEQSVCNELDVLAHELGVHAQEGTRKRVSKELLLNTDGLSDDVLDDLRAGAVAKMGEEKAGKISMETLVTRDELVGKSEARHKTTLLQPEDGSEGSTEEDSLDSSEGDKTLAEGRLLVLDPADGPVSLLADAGNCETC